ncbi:unnamed protein product [Enterobius vermicularis]|uniref:Coiled-coil domain-containing protein 134 n=1 Tax=Enterobius vermicularis TaxID=51028 RepID=A0A0N4UW56_ENTVE|nr:unnamed protein product [Enterobius vermicularis]
MNIFCNYKNFLDRKLLRMKHREQLAAVQNIVNIGDKKKQKKLLDELLVVRTAKGVIERSGYQPKDPFPEKDEKLRDAVSNVVENTAFFCEFVLRFPTKFYRLKKSQEWNELVRWGYEFTSAMNVYDTAEKKLLNLAAQQLSLIPRDENFHNPYDKKVQKEEIEREEAREKRKLEKQKEKKQRKERKPSLSKNEL